MKRDMDLVRELLMAVESLPSGFAREELQIKDHTQEEVDYHAFLMKEAGLVQAVDVTSMGSPSPEAKIMVTNFWILHGSLANGNRQRN